MSVIVDLGKAFVHAFSKPHPRVSEVAAPEDTREIRLVKAEMDRNIDSSRRIREAAEGVVHRLAARSHL